MSSLEMVFQFLAVRDDALVISTTSRMHVNEVLDSLADGTAALCGDSASLRVAQDFLKTNTTRLVLGEV
jgi:hypothetical protein